MSKPNAFIAQLVIDTRTSHQFRDGLFIALKGSQRDGHAFINQAYTKGIKSFLVHHLPDDYQSYDGNFIVHPDPLKALQKLASWHRSKFVFPVIAITGSNGKTIVKEWFSQVATAHLSLVKSPKSYNSQIGVPLSVWQMNEQHAMGLFEAGISQPGEMEALQAILKPGIGVFTTLGTAHEENFPSQKDKMYEKALLFKDCEKVIFPADEKLVKEVLEEVLPPAVLHAWSWKDDRATYLVSWKDLANSDGKTGLRITFPSKEVLTIYPTFFDQASVHNLITTAILLFAAGIPVQAIERGLESLRNIDSRLQLRSGRKGCLIIDDTYNNDLSGLKVALHYLNSFQYGKGKIAILSDLAQVKNLKEVYAAVAESLVQYGVSALLSVGNDFRLHFSAPKEMEWVSFENTQGLITYLKDYSPKDKVILVKGSRRYQLENVSDVLAESLHPTRLEINLERVLNNLRGFRSRLVQPTIKMMVMLKASAYGTGAAELAKLLEFQGVDYFAVAYPEEGVELRESGVTTPIMVMNTRPEQYELLIQYQLEPEIFSFLSLNAFYNFCKKSDLKSGIHINLDVGMHRLGFLPDDIPELGDFLKKANGVLEVKSIYAHMVASGNPVHDDFTRTQILSFKDCSDALITFLSTRPLLHMVNTEGILRFPEAHFDMVRLGIGLYGIGSANFLKPAVRLISTISQIKWLEADQTVGYNRAGQLTRKSKIGILAMGYADGLSRNLGNRKGGAYIRGKYAPFIGDICMDMSMIDLTDVDDVLEGDEVEIFGETQNIENFAKEQKTIPYDVLSSLNRRVQRNFYFD